MPTFELDNADFLKFTPQFIEHDVETMSTDDLKKEVIKLRRQLLEALHIKGFGEQRIQFLEEKLARLQSQCSFEALSALNNPYLIYVKNF